MQGLLTAILLSFALASARPAGAQLHVAAPPDTAQLRQAFAAALGGDFEIVRTELHSSLYERGGIWWMAHVRPLRTGVYSLVYVHDYIDRVKPHDPLYTHVEHTTSFSIGDAECWRKGEGRTACMGDILAIPIMAGDGRGPLGGHVFEVTRRGDAGAWTRYEQPLPPDEDAATTPNPAAPQLRYLGRRLGEMPHRSLGETLELSAVFEASEPGALELVVGGITVPVMVVARGTPVTVLLEHERIRQYHDTAGFASHLGSQYGIDLLLLQPGDRIEVQFLSRSVRGMDFTDAREAAFARTPPEITVRPFRLDPERRFNALIANHLPATR